MGIFPNLLYQTELRIDKVIVFAQQGCAFFRYGYFPIDTDRATGSPDREPIACLHFQFHVQYFITHLLHEIAIVHHLCTPDVGRQEDIEPFIGGTEEKMLGKDRLYLVAFVEPLGAVAKGFEVPAVEKDGQLWQVSTSNWKSRIASIMLTWTRALCPVLSLR